MTPFRLCDADSGSRHDRAPHQPLAILLPMLALLALDGCGSSPPQHFYLLAAVDGTVGQAVAGPLYRVDAVTIPSQLDRLQLVRRIDPNRLDITDAERWAAPLDEQIRQVMADDLAQRLPGRFVAPASPAGDTATGLIAVDIDRFEANTGGEIVLAAEWSLRAGDHISLRRTELVRVSADGTDVAAAPAAMSRALGLLADRIVTTLSQNGDR